MNGKRNLLTQRPGPGQPSGCCHLTSLMAFSKNRWAVSLERASGSRENKKHRKTMGNLHGAMEPGSMGMIYQRKNI